MRFPAILPAVALLAACGGQETTGAGSAISTLSHSDIEKCGGTNGVSASPCPLIISKSSGGYAQFNINGNGVVYSRLSDYQADGYCYNKKRAEVCYVENLGSPPTYWQAVHGPHCGKAKPLTFYAYGENGFVGYGYLQVINRDCS